MIVRYDPDFLQDFKQANVRIRKSFKQKLEIFTKNPFDPQLNNHTLQREYMGCKSIDITNDWRAIYVEKIEEEDVVAYFIALGTHDELYKKPLTD